MHNKKFLFIGTRFGVLEYMLQNHLNVTALLPYGKNNQILQDTTFYTFHDKIELLNLIRKIEFDILVSNGCPYIIPVSQLKKKNQIFINLHPSLLPNLKGPHPINGAILTNQKTGATCHIMNDEIDSGAIISQVNVFNEQNISLALLYQMCFLAEIQAFDLALQNSFVPKLNNNQEKTYFKRTKKVMLVNFQYDDIQTIIKKVQAFNIKEQYAKLLFKDKEYSLNSAQEIKNSFLNQYFQNSAEKTVILVYENFILVKIKDSFLEIGVVQGIQDFQIGDSLIQQGQISIYQTPQYSSCLTKNHFSFTFSKDHQTFYNLSEILEIPYTQYKDMSSPYGYSGYFTNSTDINFVKDALEAQSIQVQKQNIIAEFIRFNPYQNHQIFAKFLDFYTLEKQMVEVNTNYQIRWENYQSRLKTKLRKSLSTLQIQRSNNLEKFFELYTQTMQRNQAQNFYYFSLQYFQKLSQLNGFIMFEAIYEKEICAMAIFLYDKNRSYYHLGANSTITLTKNLNAMSAIFETFFQYAEQKGIISCLLGGGRTTNPSDSLLQYKKQYSPTLIDFYIGGKIYDHQTYHKLSKKSSNNFFLKYRYTNKEGGGPDITFLLQGGKCA